MWIFSSIFLFTFIPTNSGITNKSLPPSSAGIGRRFIRPIFIDNIMKIFIRASPPPVL